MSFTVGHTQLQDALKELMIRWERTKQKWDDQKSREFEEEMIAPLKPRIKATLAALERVGSVAAQARRECE
jgi:hypothetical protein